MHSTLPKISDEIPTSSMADIAFLLIIFFMVTAVFTASRGLDFALPEDTPTQFIDPIESMLVEVHSDGTVSLDSKPLSLSILLDHVAPKLAQNPLKPVIVKADLDASYRVMVEVLDELRMGRTRLGLADEIVISIPSQREMELFWH